MDDDAAGGGVVERRGGHELRLLEENGGLGGVRAHDPDDHRDVAFLPGAGLDQAARDLVAAGDPAEDVDEDRVHLRVREDQAHRGRDLVGPRAAADVEEVRGLSAGPLDEVHRRHRQPGAVHHAADRPVELDERETRLARLAVGRILLVGVAQRLELGMAGEGGIVEGDLGVEALEPLGDGAVGRRVAHDRERIDLDEVGVIREHRPDEARRDRDGILHVGAEPEPERHLARLPRLEADQRVGVDRDDRVRALGRDLLDLDAALRRAHEQDLPGRPIEDRGQVELLDDVRGRPDEDLADRDALDLELEDRPGDAFGLLGRARQLHPAGLATPADEHLGLDHDLPGAGGEVPLRGFARLGGRVGHVPGRDRQALGDEQRLGVGFLDLHASGLRVVWRAGRRWYRAGDRPSHDGTAAGGRLAILGERGHIGRAAAEGRHAAGTRGTSATRRS